MEPSLGVCRGAASGLWSGSFDEGSAAFLANLTREQAKHLNARMHKVLEDTLRHNLELPWGQTRAAMRLPTNTGDRNYYAAGLHPVQAVHSCSWPSCTLMKCFVARRATKSFVASAPNNTKPSLGTKLKRSFALVAAMIKAHPCLKSDFQVFLRNDGAVLNVDLDRCDDYGVSWKLALVARIPGFCEHRPDQVVFDKVLGQLYERLRQ